MVFFFLDVTLNQKKKKNQYNHTTLFKHDTKASFKFPCFISIYWSFVGGMLQLRQVVRHYITDMLDSAKTTTEWCRLILNRSRRTLLHHLCLILFTIFSFAILNIFTIWHVVSSKIFQNLILDTHQHLICLQ